MTNFKRADFKTMRKMVNSRLKGKVKNFKTTESAWRLFKNIVLEAQMVCVSMRKKTK